MYNSYLRNIWKECALSGGHFGKMIGISAMRQQLWTLNHLYIIYKYTIEVHMKHGGGQNKSWGQNKLRLAAQGYVSEAVT